MLARNNNYEMYNFNRGGYETKCSLGYKGKLCS